MYIYLHGYGGNWSFSNTVCAQYSYLISEHEEEGRPDEVSQWLESRRRWQENPSVRVNCESFILLFLYLLSVGE